MTQINPIPTGFHAVTPHLVIEGAAAAIDFYKKAFGAEEIARMPAPDGKRLMHAQIRIGDSIVMLGDEFPEYGPPRNPRALGASSAVLHLYVKNADAAFDRAIQAGATVIMPPTDMFWGDRYSQVKDPFGYDWAIAQHIRDMSLPEMMDAAKNFKCE